MAFAGCRLSLFCILFFAIKNRGCIARCVNKHFAGVRLKLLGQHVVWIEFRNIFGTSQQCLTRILLSHWSVQRIFSMPWVASSKSVQINRTWLVEKNNWNANWHEILHGMRRWISVFWATTRTNAWCMADGFNVCPPGIPVLQTRDALAETGAQRRSCVTWGCDVVSFTTKHVVMGKSVLVGRTIHHGFC